MIKMKLIDPLIYFRSEKLRQKMSYYQPPNFPFFLNYHSIHTYFAYVFDGERSIAETAMIKIGRRLHIERLLLEEKEELEAVISAITNFAQRWLKVHEIQFHVITQTCNRIFFPGSSTPIGSLIPPDYSDFFADRFEEINRRTCYQFDHIASRASESDQPTYDLDWTEGTKPKLYYQFHGVTKYPDMIHEVYGKLLSRDYFILVLWADRRPMVLVHWYPNYYEFLKTDPFALFSDVEDDHVLSIIKQLKEAKIFKILFHPSLPEHIRKDRLAFDAIQAMMRFFRNRFSFEHIQIGNFTQGCSFAKAAQISGANAVYEFTSYSHRVQEKI